jgi:hypothetical protein
MDTHILDIILRRSVTSLISLVIVIILLGGMLVWGSIKTTWAARKRKQSNPASSKTSGERQARRRTEEWIQVGEYNIFVHQVIEQFHQKDQKIERVIYTEVEYRNQTEEESMSCRRNQWHLFAQDGYSYEAVSELSSSFLYRDRRYFGGERYINPGMNVRGWLAFPVPEKAKIMMLQFMTGFIGTKIADIDVEQVIQTEAFHSY